MSAKALIRHPLLLLLGLILFLHYDLFFLGKALTTRSAEMVGLCGELFKPQFEFFGGATRVVADPVTSGIFNEPMSFLARKQLRQGALPLWTNQIGFGNSILANAQTGVLFPLNWIAYLHPDARGIDIAILFKFLLCYFSMFYFLRRLGLGAGPSLLGSLFYAGTGEVLWRANMNIINVYGIAPLYLAALFDLHRGIKLHENTCLLAISFALLVFGGFPQTTIAVLYLGLFLQLYWFFTGPVEGRKENLAYGTLGYALGLLLSAVQWMPLFQALSLQPPGNYRAFMGGISVELGPMLYRLLFPVVGQHGDVLSPAYFGLFPALFFLLGVLFIVKEKNWLWGGFLLAIMLYLFKALGVPLVSELIYHLPFVKVTRFSRDFIPFIWIGLSVVAAYGVDRFASHPKHLWFVIGLLLLWVFAAYQWGPNSIVPRSGGDWMGYFNDNKPVIWSGGFFVVLLLCFVIGKARVGVLVTLTLLGCFCNLPRRLADSEKMDLARLHKIDSFLSSTLQPHQKLFHSGSLKHCYSQLSAPFGYNALTSSDPLMPQRYYQFMSGLFKCGDGMCLSGVSGARSHDPWLAWRMAGVNYHLTLDESPGDLKKLPKAGEQIYQDENALPKAYLTRSCRVFKNSEALTSELREAHLPPDAAYLEQGHTSGLSRSRLLACERKASVKQVLEISKYTNREIVLAGEFGGIVVLTEQFHPDWVAYVGEQEVPIFPVFGTYRGVYAPRGAEQVRFVYRPIPLYAGAGLGLLGLCGLLGVFLRRKRE